MLLLADIKHRGPTVKCVQYIVTMMLAWGASENRDVLEENRRSLKKPDEMLLKFRFEH